MRRAGRQRRHLVMREVHAALTRTVAREIANVGGRVVRQAAIVDSDIEDAGEDPQCAKDDRARLLRCEL